MLPRVLGSQRLCVILGALAGGCDQTPHGLLLILPGLVVEEDAHCDKDGANGRQAGDLVAKNDDAEPDGQGVLHSAGDATATEQRERSGSGLTPKQDSLLLAVTAKCYTMHHGCVVQPGSRSQVGHG